MTTRRNFIKNTTLGVAALTAAPLAAVASTTSEAFVAETDHVNRDVFKQIRASIFSYSFHGLVGQGMMDIFHFFETCKYRYGLDAADLWNGMFPQLDDKFIDKVHSALEDRQLVIPNIAADGAHIMYFGNDDPVKIREMQDRYMQIAKRLGVGFVRFDAGPQMHDGRKDVDGWTNQEFDYIVKRYKELAQYAYDNGFRVGSENHYGPACVWKHMEKLIKAVDHPGFGICQHFGGWRGTYEENLLAEKAAAPYTLHTHIPWQCSEDPNLHLRLGVLRDVNYPGYYSVEHHSGQNEYNLVEVQLSKVKAVLTSWNRDRDGLLYPRRDRNWRIQW